MNFQWGTTRVKEYNNNISHSISLIRPAAAAKEKKTRKYSDTGSPLRPPKCGGEHALDPVTEIDRRIAAVTHDTYTSNICSAYIYVNV